MNGWDAPGTAAYYEAFCRRYGRYRRANLELVSHARIEPGMRVLDLAAGTGRTAQAALARLGGTGRVVCVEPSASMRVAGARRVRSSCVTWRAGLPRADRVFDRVLCGAAIWQIQPIETTLRRLATLLRPGGALCFTIPAVYLQEPDQPGGGRDPLLLGLPAILARPRRRVARAAAPLTVAAMAGSLENAGYEPVPWGFRSRFTQVAYAEWLKIPVVTEGMLAGLPAATRAQMIDDAMRMVDRSSWKWERWRGWTAWTH